MIRSVRGLVGALALAGMLGCGDEGDDGNSTGQGGGGGVQLTFTRDVHPILTRKCGDSNCHGSSTRGLPGHGAADVAEAYAAVTGLSYAGGPLYERILERTAETDPFAVMPPMSSGCMGGLGTTGCLTQAEHDTIEAWVEQGYPL
jgi:hypothetical protein